MHKIVSIMFISMIFSISSSDIYEDSYALVIGIDKYKYVNPQLNYAVADAEKINDILINTFQFKKDNITLLRNEEATKQNILKCFSDITKVVNENDRVLIFFAGHGETYDLPEGGEMGYLIPVDGDTEDLYFSSIPMDELKKISLISKAKHMLYLVDACYGGLATVNSRGLTSNTPNYIDKITSDNARQIITAGGRGEEVVEKAEWGHSAFTLNLKRGLEDGKADFNSDGVITTNELSLFLKEKVTIDSKHRQTPQSSQYTSQEGEFVFIYSENTIINQNEDKSSDDKKLDAILSQLDELNKKVNEQEKVKKQEQQDVSYNELMEGKLEDEVEEKLEEAIMSSLDENESEPLDSSDNSEEGFMGSLGGLLNSITGSGGFFNNNKASVLSSESDSADSDDGDKVDIGWDGISVDDDGDKVEIGWDGISVDDGDKVKIGWDGIFIEEEDGSKVEISWSGISVTDGDKEDEDILKSELEFNNGVVLQSKEYYKNGDLKEEIAYKDGKVSDLYEYYKNGTLEMHYNVVKEIYQEYYKNGSLKSQGKIDNTTLSLLSLANLSNLSNLGSIFGVPDGEGVNKEYYENGIIKEEVSYSNGKLHGLYREFHPNGSLKSECNFVNGLIEGKLKEYYQPH